MYNVARSTNHRAAARRELYTVETRLGLKPSILHFPLKLGPEIKTRVQYAE